MLCAYLACSHMENGGVSSQFKLELSTNRSTMDSLSFPYKGVVNVVGVRCSNAGYRNSPVRQFATGERHLPFTVWVRR